MDYHTPTDTWEKINYKGMVEISDLVFNVAKETASEDSRLQFKEAGPKVETTRYPMRKGVTLGIMPDFAGVIKNGLRADFVTPGKPAALGGMQKGDIITFINGKPVNNIQDYMFRMGQLKHGQTISVEVLRNDKKSGSGDTIIKFYTSKSYMKKIFSKMKKFILWILAFLITFSAAIYQRMTGPTYPKRLEVHLMIKFRI